MSQTLRTFAWKAKAIIAALQDANGEHAEIFTDSEFWINVITKWSIAWKPTLERKKAEIKNLDIVDAETKALYRQGNATLVWVRIITTTCGNRLADEWANKARENKLKSLGLQNTALL